jgi:hypothetical protein
VSVTLRMTIIATDDGNPVFIVALVILVATVITIAVGKLGTQTIAPCAQTPWWKVSGAVASVARR